MFSCPPSINKSKDLENWNSNILEVPMSGTSYMRLKILPETEAEDVTFDIQLKTSGLSILT